MTFTRSNTLLLVLRLIVCLLTGAVLSMLVAWTLANSSFDLLYDWPHVYGRTNFRPVNCQAQGAAWTVDRSEGVGYGICQWQRLGTEANQVFVERAASRITHWTARVPWLKYVNDRPALPNAWSHVARWPTAPNDIWFSDERAYGWPWLCVARCTVNSAPAANVGGGYVETTSGNVALNKWDLPYLPIPLGLTLNTLFYASFTALFWLSLARARRALRIRRHHCPTCTYNLRGLSPDPVTNLLTCPECGSSRRIV